MSPLELAANAFNLISILLAGRASVHTWWTGIVGSILFLALFVNARLYADASLQVFFIVTSVIGWVGWHRTRGDAGEVPIRRAPRVHLLVGTGVAILLTAGYAALLARTTNAAAPIPDSAVLAFSILGQLLLTARAVESWPCWLLVNSISVPLYVSRGLHLTAGLYAIFWVNAIVSWRRWAIAARRTPSAATSPAPSP